jgi:hypothetical protein
MHKILLIIRFKLDLKIKLRCSKAILKSMLDINSWQKLDSNSRWT